MFKRARRDFRHCGVPLNFPQGGTVHPCAVAQRRDVLGQLQRLNPSARKSRRTNRIQIFRQDDAFQRANARKRIRTDSGQALREDDFRQGRIFKRICFYGLQILAPCHRFQRRAAAERRRRDGMEALRHLEFRQGNVIPERRCTQARYAVRNMHAFQCRAVLERLCADVRQRLIKRQRLHRRAAFKCRFANRRHARERIGRNKRRAALEESVRNRRQRTFAEIHRLQARCIFKHACLIIAESRQEGQRFQIAQVFECAIINLCQRFWHDKALLRCAGSISQQPRGICRHQRALLHLKMRVSLCQLELRQRRAVTECIRSNQGQRFRQRHRRQRNTAVKGFRANHRNIAINLD